MDCIRVRFNLRPFPVLVISRYMYICISFRVLLFPRKFNTEHISRCCCASEHSFCEHRPNDASLSPSLRDFLFLMTDQFMALSMTPCRTSQPAQQNPRSASGEISQHSYRKIKLMQALDPNPGYFRSYCEQICCQYAVHAPLQPT